MPPRNDEPNYLAHLFKSQYNLIGLGTAVGFALVGGTLFPLLIAAGVEMVFLPLISGSGLYQRAVRAKLAHENDLKRRQLKANETSEMLQYLPDAERVRYRNLQGLAQEIRENYKTLNATSQGLLDELSEKLDFLLTFFLRMRSSLMRYRTYFTTTDPDKIAHRITLLDNEIERGLPDRVKQIKLRTRGVLEKRLERYKRAHENQQLIEAQAETVMEVMQLLRDQSYAITDPKSITGQIDHLVQSAEETERGVRDLEELLSMGDEDWTAGESDPDMVSELMGAMKDANAAVPGSSPNNRNRVRR